MASGFRSRGQPYVLESIINLIITFSKCNLAFRGHRELDGNDNEAEMPCCCGNFMELIHLLVRYDPVLHNLQKQQQGSINV